jgi:hypothetical protein
MAGCINEFHGWNTVARVSDCNRELVRKKSDFHSTQVSYRRGMSSVTSRADALHQNG